MNIGINKAIRTLIFSDFLLQSAWGLIGPIFAIFITQQIAGGSIAVVGFIVATYWLTKSIAQPFIGRFFDIQKGEEDDFKFLLWGLVISSLIPLGYIFSTHMWHLLLLEFIRAWSWRLLYPAGTLFSRAILHLDGRHFLGV